jgi:hypothetical protein
MQSAVSFSGQHPHSRRYCAGLWERGNAAFAHLLQIAMGFASELACDFLRARDRNILSPSKAEWPTAEVIEAKRMLASFIPMLRADR